MGKTLLFTVIVILSNVLGNLSLSYGMRHAPGSGSLEASPLGYVRVLFTPWVALGVVLLILWLTSRMALLSWADLSFVLPVTSVGYVLAAVLGRVFLAEEVPWSRWGGAVLIMTGSILVGLTPPRTIPETPGDPLNPQQQPAVTIAERSSS
jgi:drug/metabolite transporter (DMT)-like permease